MTVKRHSLGFDHVQVALPVQDTPYRLSALAFAASVVATSPVYTLTVKDGSGAAAFKSEIFLTFGLTSACFAVNYPPGNSVSTVAVGFLPPDLWVMPTDTVEISSSAIPDASFGPIVFTTEEE